MNIIMNIKERAGGVAWIENSLSRRQKKSHHAMSPLIIDGRLPLGPNGPRGKTEVHLLIRMDSKSRLGGLEHEGIAGQGFHSI